jgi:hypothetical protein
MSRHGGQKKRARDDEDDEDMTGRVNVRRLRIKRASETDSKSNRIKNQNSFIA